MIGSGNVLTGDESGATAAGPFYLHSQAILFLFPLAKSGHPEAFLVLVLNIAKIANA